MRWFKRGRGWDRYVRFELDLLADLGFGLDLGRCAVTGAQRGSRLRLAALGPGGEPCRRRALMSIACCRCPRSWSAGGRPDRAQIRAGLQLTGAFLRRHLFDASDSAAAARAPAAARPARPFGRIVRGHDSAAQDRADPPRRLRRRPARALSRLRAFDHHGALAAGRARRPQAGAAPRAVRHAQAAARPGQAPTRSPRAWSAT